MGIRRVLTELEADNWKHRSNYTVTSSLTLGLWEGRVASFTEHWNTVLFSINYYNVMENGKIKIGPHMSNNLWEINVVVISECI